MSLFLIQGASQMAQWLKNIHLPMQETQEIWVQSLGWEDTLEKGMATHSSVLVWRIPWTEEPGGLQSMGSQSWTRLSDFHCQLLKMLLSGNFCQGEA